MHEDRAVLSQDTPQPIITLLTDFGLQDEYAAVMKGVILSHAPNARIVDISHLVPPQSIRTAAHLLVRAYRFFPVRTVHVVVVDPEVGTPRAILAIDADDQLFIGPDNGVFTPILEHATDLAIHRIEPSPQLFRQPLSATFHGRDIMAPAAALLACGVAISRLGPPMPPPLCRRLKKMTCTRTEHLLQGEIIHIDAFGNLCSDISRQDIEAFAPDGSISVHLAGHTTVPLNDTYASSPPGALLALYDSYGLLEVAVNRGNAAKQLKVQRGAEITISRRQINSSGI